MKLKKAPLTWFEDRGMGYGAENAFLVIGGGLTSLIFSRKLLRVGIHSRL